MSLFIFVLSDQTSRLTEAGKQSGEGDTVRQMCANSRVSQPSGLGLNLDHLIYVWSLGRGKEMA